MGLMKVSSNDQASDAWDKCYEEVKAEIFKCEVLQDYSAVDMGPSLQAWLDGEKQRSIQLYLKSLNDNEWGKQYAAKKIKKTRVHIVTKPYTPYLEWEIEVYKNSRWGEDIYLVQSSDVSYLEIPDGDFWIFDGKRVIKFTYTGDRGESVGGEIYDENDNISRFITCQTELLKHAVKV